MKRFLVLCLFAAAANAADDRVKVDNDTLRILSVVDQPHHRSALHQHVVNRVMVYLDAGDIDIVDESGKVEHQHWKAGDIAWSPAGPKHTSENVGGKDIRIVEVELKKAGPGKVKRDAKLDPVKNDPAHNTLAYENDQVRVFRSTREPGGEEKLHEHLGAGRVIVMLTDLDVIATSGDGQANPVKAKRGDAMWTAGKTTHKGKNVSAQAYEMVIIEVK